MSKKSKAIRAVKRREEKRAEKDRQKRYYEGLRDQGVNTKSKRARRNAKAAAARTLRTTRHAEGACGNAGCKKCHPPKVIRSRQELNRNLPSTILATHRDNGLPL